MLELSRCAWFLEGANGRRGEGKGGSSASVGKDHRQCAWETNQISCLVPMCMHMDVAKRVYYRYVRK